MNTYLPKQEIVTPSRSNYNLTGARVFPARIGSLYPAYWRRVPPHSVLKFNPVVNITSNPLVSDLKGTFRVHIETFFEPYSNLYGAFDNNHIVPSDMQLHIAKVESSSSSASSGVRIPYIPNGGILNYLYGGAGSKLFNTASPSSPFLRSTFNLEPMFSYLDIVRTYYRCDQVGYLPYTGSGGASTESTNYVISDSVDKFFLRLRQNIVGINFNSISMTSAFSNTDTSYTYPSSVISPNISQYYTTILRANIGDGNDIGSGLFYRPLNRDIFSTQITSNSSTRISTPLDNTRFYVNDLYAAMRAEEMAAMHDYTSGRMRDFVSALYGEKVTPNSDRPRLVNVQSAYIDINTVRTTAATADQPAASSIGSIVFENTFKPFHFSSNGDYGILMTIISLSPVQVYSNCYQFGSINVNNFDDVYNPALDGLPPQSLTALYLDSSAENLETSLVSLGRFPAFIDQFSDVNRSFDLFEKNQPLDYWTTTFKPRRTFSIFSSLPTDANTAVDPYIHPDDWTFMFADTSARSRNIYITYQPNTYGRLPKSKILQKLY